MPRRLISVGDAKPILDIASYARGGLGRRDQLSKDEVELIARTVGGAPEVMVKVLSRGGKDLKAVGRHIAYLNRRGDLEVEADDGQRLSGKGVEKELFENWDLDLEERRSGGREYWSRRSPPRLVHKLMFSMPAGTPPDKVLAAVKSFAREEFALKHRYAMVLHTDEPHPHVHMVVKAVSEQGERLSIRKATLREWRREFARHLRDQGIAANATERAVRGETRTHKTDGIYRATLRGDSSHTRQRIEIVAGELRNGGLRAEPGKAHLTKTRREVDRGWRTMAEILRAEGQWELAGHVKKFADRMPPPRTEKERIVWELARRTRQTAREGVLRER